MFTLYPLLSRPMIEDILYFASSDGGPYTIFTLYIGTPYPVVPYHTRPKTWTSLHHLLRSVYPNTSGKFDIWKVKAFIGLLKPILVTWKIEFHLSRVQQTILPIYEGSKQEDHDGPISLTWAKELCTLTVEVSAKFTALRFLYNFYSPDPQRPCFFSCIMTAWTESWKRITKGTILPYWNWSSGFWQKDF